MEPLMGDQQERNHGRAHNRRIQGWTGRVLRHGTIWPEWQIHPGSIYLVEDRHEFASLRTVVLGGWRQNLGSKLDHGPDTGKRRTWQSTLTSVVFATEDPLSTPGAMAELAIRQMAGSSGCH